MKAKSALQIGLSMAGGIAVLVSASVTGDAEANRNHVHDDPDSNVAAGIGNKIDFTNIIGKTESTKLPQFTFMSLNPDITEIDS